MAITIRLSGDKASVCVEGTVSRDGRLLEVQEALFDKPQYRPLLEAYRLLPAILSELAPGYIEPQDDNPNSNSNSNR